jgi:ribosomal protein S18 acetylase RimI-like enzyme
VVEIIAPDAPDHISEAVVEATPEMFKAFWPDVRGSYFFRNRRVFLDFMRTSGGRIYYIGSGQWANPPFILVGNWRSRADITALWHVKGEGVLKRILVEEAVSRSFDAGSEDFVTKPLGEYEAEEYGSWGFRIAYKIVLLEKQLHGEPATADAENGLEIIRYRKRYMGDVLSLDATAFDDFWRLDARTMEAVASTCYHNAFLLALRGDEVLGYAVGGANGRFGYLQRLGIRAGHQGGGVGELLSRRLISALQVMGARSVMVNTQEENTAALGLYRKIGFETLTDRRFIMRRTPQDLELAK